MPGSGWTGRGSRDDFLLIGTTESTVEEGDRVRDTKFSDVVKKVGVALDVGRDTICPCLRCRRRILEHYLYPGCPSTESVEQFGNPGTSPWTSNLSLVHETWTRK